MADSYREPGGVYTKEVDSQTVEVMIFCDDIEVGPLKGNINAKVDVKFKETSFCVTAEVKNKNRTVNYRKVIKRLPGEILPDSCSYKVVKGMVILELKKKEERSWASQMRSGLEQSSSEESD